MMVCPYCHHLVSVLNTECRNPECPRPGNPYYKLHGDPLAKYKEIDLPRGVLGQERIVGIVNFRGDVIIATERRVLRMTHDEFTEVKFEELENR